jgi:hypothetical protein
VTKPPADPAISAISNPQELREWFVSQLPPGAEITSLGFFCTSDLSDRVLCLVGYRNAQPGAVAKALGGQMFGFDSVVVSLPLGKQFKCSFRKDGERLSTRSCSCLPGTEGVPSMLDKLD